MKIHYARCFLTITEKFMNNKYSMFQPITSFIVALLSLTVASAASITWTSASYAVTGGYGQVLSTGQFVKTGSLIRAENVGGGARTFDGISFTAGTINFSGTFNGFHEGDTVSQSGTYGSSGANTVTVSGLTIGNTYRIQALVYDGRGTGITGRTVSFDGINQGRYANGVQNVTYGPGLLVTGMFVADAITQNFTIEAFAGASSVGGQLNALLVHELPPPVIPFLENPSISAITGSTAQANVTLSNTSSELTLYWDTVDQGTGAWSNANPLGSQAVGPVSGGISGLSPDTIYFYRFRAVNTATDPATSSWSTVATAFGSSLAGKAPADPSATTFSKTEIDVVWTDNFTAETSFVIERSPNGTSSWTQAGTALANAQIFYDSGLFPNTTYYYRVRAQNGGGFSDPSTVVSATTNVATPGINVQAWYRMGDGGQGANNLPTDSSTNARNFTGNVSSASISANGGGYRNDSFYTFNGVDQGYYGSGFDAPENNVGIEVWVRTSDLAQAPHHVFGTGSNLDGINIGFEPTSGRGWFGAIAGNSYVGSVGAANYVSGTWVHLALVRDYGVTTFYVNGVASGTSTISPFDATSVHLAINSGGAPGAYFGGDVAEARIFTFDPGQFTVGDLLYPGDPYIAWASGLTDPSVASDFDSGGLPTGIEWVTGGNPALGSDDASVTPIFDNTSNPNNFLFTFRRRDAAAADAGTSIVVEYGSDLSGWRNTTDHGASDGVTVDASTDLGGGFHQVTVAIPRSLALGGKLFSRLKVSRP